MAAAAAAPAHGSAHVDDADHALPEVSGSDARRDSAQEKGDRAFRRNFNSFRNAVLGLVGMEGEAGLAKAEKDQTKSRPEKAAGLAKAEKDQTKSRPEKAARLTKAERIQMKNHRRCEMWKWRFLRRDPAVVFMLDKLSEAGCEVDPERFISCVTCDAQKGGGFHVVDGVSLCENRVHEKRMMEEALVHELMHAYDHCRYKVDWSNLYHHACAEVRAANLSGDCRFFNELRRGNVGIMGQHIRCVRRRAILSVMDNPNCANEAEAAMAVNRVFASCFNDTTPFEEGHYY